MGMAASQARFLGLTARKTNVEYEGQQINQQRTTLANQTANYYNQLLGMSVPVPPSVADYTKTVYTFQDGSLSNSISSMIAQANGTYLISYTSSWVDDFAAVSAATSIVTKTDMPATTPVDVTKVTNTEDNTTTYQVDGAILTLKAINGKEYYVLETTTDNVTSYKYFEKDAIESANYGDTTTPKTPTVTPIGQPVAYKVGAKELRDMTLGVINLPGLTVTDNKVTGTYTGNDEYLKSLSNDQIEKLLQEEQEYIEILNKQYGNAEWTVRYVQNTTTGTWTPYFAKKDVLDSAIYSDNGSSQSSIPMYTIGSAQKTEEIKGKTARLEQDATGRIINVTLNPGAADEVTYAVATTTLTDQAKYDDAMNQYEYDKFQYDQSIQEINSKIEIIQAEDKNLELRLKQLDTEQDAIQTEMDAVQKVIEKNTESTFKTFG